MVHKKILLILVLGIFLISMASAFNLNNKLMSYWDFDEQDTSGTGTIIDRVGNNDGSNVGASNSTGKINTA